MLALIYITKSLDLNLYDKSLIFLVMNLETKKRSILFLELKPGYECRVTVQTDHYIS